MLVIYLRFEGGWHIGNQPEQLLNTSKLNDAIDENPAISIVPFNSFLLAFTPSVNNG
jgi:hypothetical protein